MKIVAAISSPHQDEVIERILRHLNLWLYGLALRARLRAFAAPALVAAHPPWKRQRKARGPPPSTGPPERWSGEPESPRPIDAVIDDELYVVDPPLDEDSPT